MRARRLSPERRREIASSGGAARRESIAAAQRIADNFAYVEAVEAFGGGPPRLVRLSHCDGPLPGLPGSARP